MAEAMDRYLDLVLHQAIQEREDYEKLSWDEKDARMEAEAKLYERAFTLYTKMQNGATKKEFDELWRDSLKHLLSRQQGALSQLELSERKQRRRYSM